MYTHKIFTFITLVGTVVNNRTLFEVTAISYIYELTF